MMNTLGPDRGPTPPPAPLWEPSGPRASTSRLADFARWSEHRHGRSFDSYRDLWSHSTADVGAFWADVADYFSVVKGLSAREALADASMPGAVWFPGVNLNFAELALRGFGDENPVVIAESEGRDPVTIRGAELRQQVGAFARTLLDLGIEPGDRVAGVLPNTLPALVAFLGTASVGGVWTLCAPDFGTAAVLDRLAQTEPRVLVVADGYHFGGRAHDRMREAREIIEGLTSVDHCVWVSSTTDAEGPAGTIPWQSCVEGGVAEPVPLPFAHPLWILFSSGTTGRPKGIMHSHGGVALEQLKSIGLHMDTGPGDRFFWYTSTAWMMWNVQVAALLTGATAVLYDGSPRHPDLYAQWALAERHRLTFLGTSAGYLTACTRAGLDPADRFDLNALRTVGSTGSPLPAPAYRWVYDRVSDDVLLTSTTGGTDVATGFLGGSPTLPVYEGELSGPLLGVAVDAWDPDGKPVVGVEGELVVTKPMPSMPVSFWDDPDGTRYRDAYFSTYPGVWRHGDWLELTDRGTGIVSGRSDSTLNRGGVRMGTADVYAALDSLPEVVDCVMLGVEQTDGSYWMPLFVVLSSGARLDDRLRGRITDCIATTVSRRHVPDEVIVAPAIPHTKTGKRIEVPLKRLFQGVPVERALNVGSLDDPESVAFFVALEARRRRSGPESGRG